MGEGCIKQDTMPNMSDLSYSKKNTSDKVDRNHKLIFNVKIYYLDL